MKLIVGLGNPGKEYDKTRHNIGFRIIDELAINYDVNFKTKMVSQFGKFRKNGEDILLLKPLTYVNLSGASIQMLMNYFKIKIDDIIIIYDDIDLELGKIKLRVQGTSAGHNGIKSIINSLNSTKFKRIRFGIGKDKSYNTSDWVLNKFKQDEEETVTDAVDVVINIIEDYCNDFDFQRVMNQYN